VKFGLSKAFGEMLGLGDIFGVTLGLGNAFGELLGLGLGLGDGLPALLGLGEAPLSVSVGLELGLASLALGLGDGSLLGVADGFGLGDVLTVPDSVLLPEFEESDELPEPQDFFPAQTPFVTYRLPFLSRVRILISSAVTASLNGLILSLTILSQSLR